ncbi:hypothetical protein SLS62_002161 [Diatrype stigma]|uniref:3-carboxymuconate cyclase n=1 Tax=Diatrype stigma TaxID=117547 RepID=A0AAN9UUN9_9PEZI
MKFASFLGLCHLAAGTAIPRGWPQNSSAALYFLENDPAGANIVSVQVAGDGTISNPTRIPTGGKGSIGMNAMGPAAVDTLFSQDAVVVSYPYLLTVNAGSNDVSLFSIAEDPLAPRLVAPPAPSGGEFPNSVAYSPALGLACVSNTGARAGVQCYSVGPSGLEPRGAFKPIAAGGLRNQTSPPVGPPNTVSDAVFNPSGTALFVTVKGDGTDPGYIYAYPVVAAPKSQQHHGDKGKGKGKAEVAAEARVSRPAELGLDFSLTFLGTDRRAFVTDPGFGGAFLDISCDHAVTVARVANITGQMASCWSQYSATHDSVYVFDAGAPDIAVYGAGSGELATVVRGDAAAVGKFDAVVAGDFLYTLDGAASITVYSLADGGEPVAVQTLDLAAFGNRQFFQGLAFHSR